MTSSSFFIVIFLATLSPRSGGGVGRSCLKSDLSVCKDVYPLIQYLKSFCHCSCLVGGCSLRLSSVRPRHVCAVMCRGANEGVPDDAISPAPCERRSARGAGSSSVTRTDRAALAGRLRVSPSAQAT